MAAAMHYVHKDKAHVLFFFFNDTATTEIYTLSPTRRSSDLLIFLHIPKAAGTTLHSILEMHYAPANQCSIYDPEQAAKVLPLAPRVQREAIRLLKGHLAFGLHEHLIGQSTYITLVRDPVDRIASHYYYVKRMPGHYLHNAVVGQNMSLQDYASSKLTDELDNGQLRLLAGVVNDKA